MSLAFPTTPDVDHHEQVRDAVAKLPEGDRTVIDLHYFAGLTQASAAASLGLREGTMAMRLTRARDRLGKIIAHRGPTLGATALVSLLTESPTPVAEPSFLARIYQVVPTHGSAPIRPLPNGKIWWGTKELGLGAAAILVIGSTWLALSPSKPHTVEKPRPATISTAAQAPATKAAGKSTRAIQSPSGTTTTLEGTQEEIISTTTSITLSFSNVHLTLNKNVRSSGRLVVIEAKCSAGISERLTAGGRPDWRRKECSVMDIQRSLSAPCPISQSGSTGARARLPPGGEIHHPGCGH